MQALMLMTGGLLLLLLCLQLARLSGVASQANAALLFIPLWLWLAAGSLSQAPQAGNVLAIEWRAFLLVFTVPALSALWLWRQLRR